MTVPEFLTYLIMLGAAVTGAVIGIVYCTLVYLFFDINPKPHSTGTSMGTSHENPRSISKQIPQGR